jgi:uroporphyrinogen III methyltransferase/synthase
MTSVSIVGAGPGDPGLLTARGQRALGEAQVVVFDGSLPPVLPELAPPGAERVRVAAAPDDTGGLPRSAVPALLVARARAGLRVVRLVAGDAGGFGSDAAALADAGLEFEVVPGVSRPVAAAASAGVSLGDGTVAAPVEAGKLGEAVAGLRAAGRSEETPAALVVGAGTAAQRVVEAPLGRLAEAAARAHAADDAVLLAGDGVPARARLAWLERRPLFGRRVVVTRPRPQVGRFAALLEGYGAEVIALPTIRLAPPDDWGPLDAALAGLHGFAWLIFTSANGVAAFRERLAGAALDARALAGARLAAIGAETAEALGRLGLRADVVPQEYRAEGLVEALRPHVGPGTRVLLVRAAEARDVVPRELAAAGAEVTVAPAYRTLPVKEGADRVTGLLEAGAVDVVTFTSSSTVRGFLALLGSDDARRRLAGVALAAIGPITAATLAEYGLEARISPREYTIPALAAAIAAHFRPAGTPT